MTVRPANRFVKLLGPRDKGEIAKKGETMTRYEARVGDRAALTARHGPPALALGATHRPTALALAALLLALGGCGAGEDVPDEAATGGGADRAPTSLDSLPTWSAQTDLRIGSMDDPDYALTQIRGMEVGSDGTIYTLHASERTIRRFDAGGLLLGTIGGPGDGPGEFRSPQSMGWVADTLWVFDMGPSRFTLFAPSGDYLGSFTVPFNQGPDEPVVPPPWPLGLLADGTVWGDTPLWSHLVADGVITEHQPVLMTRDGEVTDTLPTIPLGNGQWSISNPAESDYGRAQLYTRQPFGDGYISAFAPGEPATVVLDPRTSVGTEGATFRVFRVGFEGDTTFSRGYLIQPETVGQAEVDSVLDEMGPTVERVFGVAPARAREWAAVALYRPEFKPAAVEMTLGRDGTIWLKRGPGDADVDEWVVLDADGDPIGRVALPRGTRVFVVDPPFLWGTVTDELDVPYVVRMRIERS